MTSTADASPPTALFLGGHAALDFVNTAFAPQGRPVELIGDGRSFVEWLVQAGLLEADLALRLQRRFGARALDDAAAQARDFRQWCREWLARWRAEPQARYDAELSKLNTLLARARVNREIVADASGQLAVVERPRYETADALIAVLAAQVAALVAAEQPPLVKHCAGAGCTLWFLDRTKAHRQLFCSAAACGNRAKVAAFRARQRSR